MITSNANSKIKRVELLIARHKQRKIEACFVIEGKKIVEEAPKELLELILVSETFSQTNKEFLEGFPKTITEIVTDKLFKQITDLVTEQGILAVVRKKEEPFVIKKNMKKGFFIALENIQDPGNMGTILRTADAAGVNGVLISAGSVDIYNPKVVRATMGSVFRVPVWTDLDLTEALGTLKKANTKIFAAHLKAKSSYDKQDYLSNTCFLIGNEGNGLTDELCETADEYIKIPIPGKAESLNAGIAAGILMYEVIRQRKN